METYELMPPWWVLLAAAVPIIASAVLLYRWVARDELQRVSKSGEHDLRGARTRSGIASAVFSLCIAGMGWLCWLLAALPPREVVFAVIWTVVSLYFVVAAGTFKTQMGRFGVTPGATARHLLQALLWGPVMVLMLLPRRDRLDEPGNGDP